MELDFSGIVWHWAGPAPFYFVSVPQGQSKSIKQASKLLTYGWGMIPVWAEIGQTRWKTAMFEKNGCYVLPLKDKVRQAEGIVEGGTVEVRLELGHTP